MFCKKRRSRSIASHTIKRQDKASYRLDSLARPIAKISKKNHFHPAWLNLLTVTFSSFYVKYCTNVQ